jgi:DNA polymerase-3 subunit delta
LRSDLAAALEKETTAQVYVLHGEDSYSRGRNADELVERLTSMRGGADVNAFDAAESSVDDIASAVMTAPMFASARVVIVRRFEEMSTEDQARLVRALAPGKRPADLRVPDETQVVIVSSSKTVPRKEVNAAGPNVAAFEFRPAWARDARAFVFERAKELGVRIEPDAASLLLELAGLDYAAISQELEKLITYLGPGGRKIGVDDIRAAVGRSSSQTVFDFCDAVIAGNSAQAMGALADIVRGERQVLAALGTLATKLRRVMEARVMLDGGSTQDEAALALVGGNPKMKWKEARTASQASRLTQTQIAAMFTRMARADLDIKTGAMSENLAMEVLVSDLCVQQKLQ